MEEGYYIAVPELAGFPITIDPFMLLELLEFEEEEEEEEERKDKERSRRGKRGKKRAKYWRTGGPKEQLHHALGT